MMALPVITITAARLTRLELRDRKQNHAKKQP